jgi:hypothetical protein
MAFNAVSMEAMEPAMDRELISTEAKLGSLDTRLS